MKVIVNQLAIEYQDQGSGPVMLFLHGWKDSLRTFDALVPLLEPNWRLIRLDLPGFGGSELPKSPWQLEDYVDLVAAFCAKLNLAPVVLIGHSLGGRIAIKGTAAGSFKPKLLVLIASAGIAKTNTARNRAYRALAKAGKVVTLVPPLVFWRHKLRARLYDTAGSDYLTAGALRQTFLNVISEDLKTAASAVKIPTLLVWGAIDSETPLADGRILSELIRGSQLEVIPGATHFVHQEQPRVVADLISKATAQ